MEANIYNYIFILNRKTRKVNLLRVGIGCMLIALIAILVAVGILKSAPAIRESRKMVVTKEG